MRAAAAMLLLVSGCVRSSGFRCTSDPQCGAGRCEPEGFCSFSDSSCGTGFRFGDYSGAQSGKCTSTEVDLSVPMGDVDLSVPGDAAEIDQAAGPRCGDGNLDIGEQCDDGAANSDAPTSAATCTTGCRRRASCGTVTGSTAVSIDPATGHCYVSWPQVSDWIGAQAACENNGGQLVTITSVEENQRVRTLAGNTEIWIGLTAPPTPPAPAHTFTWVTGESTAFTAFAAGEPNNAGSAEECVSSTLDGWADRPCGHPTAGLLPASAANPLPYVCESSCGNGLVELGEECDPPGTACTKTCRTIKMCDIPEHSSPITGHCYFLLDLNEHSYGNANNLCRPFGAHLATLNDPAETQAAFAALASFPQADMAAPALVLAWIGLKATGGATDMLLPVFPTWDPTSEVFGSRRYHSFVDPDPDLTPSVVDPVCAVVSLNYSQFGTPDGWRDRKCINDPQSPSGGHLVLCERE